MKKLSYRPVDYIYLVPALIILAFLSPFLLVYAIIYRFFIPNGLRSAKVNCE